MPLIKCPECGHMISEYANMCVSCGCPMSKISELLARKKTKPKESSIIGETKNNFREDVLSFLNVTKNELFKESSYHRCQPSAEPDQSSCSGTGFDEKCIP